MTGGADAATVWGGGFGWANRPCTRRARPTAATVTAATDLTVLVIGAREFASIIDEVPPIAHKLLRALAEKVRAPDAKAYG